MRPGNGSHTFLASSSMQRPLNGVHIQTSIGEWDSDYLILATAPNKISRSDYAASIFPKEPRLASLLSQTLANRAKASSIDAVFMFTSGLTGASLSGSRRVHRLTMQTDWLIDRASSFNFYGDGACRPNAQYGAGFVPKLADAEVQDVMIGWRPPLSRWSACPRANPAVATHYLAVMHSGVTLAPVIGQLVANEILSRQMDPRLSPYRPMRFG